MSDTELKFYYGWVVVAISFVVITLCYGVYYSFAVFLRPLLKEFGWTTAETSSIFSLCIVFRGFSGAFMGWCADRFGPKLTVTVAGISIGCGLLLTNYVSAIWQLYIFYGVIVGIGVGASYPPLASAVSRWFVRRRGLALGIVSAGTGMGTLIMAPLAERLISDYGWRTSYAVMGFVVLTIPILALLFLGRNPEDLSISSFNESEVSGAEVKSKETRQLSLRKATSAKPFWLLFFLYMSLGFATFIPLAHIVAYGIDKGIPPITAANLLGAVGGAGVVGRVLIGTSSDRFGAMRLMPLMVILQAIAMASLVGVNKTVTLFFLAVLFGFAYGACVPLFQVMIVDLFGTDHMGAIFGSLALGGTIGGALGPLVAGYMFDLAGNYHSAFLLGACFAIVGLVFFIALSFSNRPQVRRKPFDQRGQKREPAPF